MFHLTNHFAMENLQTFTFNNVLIWFIITLVAYFIVSYNWKRRWLYYYASKLPGPFAFPLVGSIHTIFATRKDPLKKLIDLVAEYQPVMKIWMGPNLYIGTTRPKDVEVLLTQCLDKNYVYKLMEEFFGESLVTGPVKKWKGRRKMINQSFGPKILENFTKIFVKQANIVAEQLDENCGYEKDIFPKMWRCTFDIVCETLGDIDPALLKTQNEQMAGILRCEEIGVEHFYNPFCHLNVSWKNPLKKREQLKLVKKSHDFIQKIIDLKEDGPENNLDNDVNVSDTALKKKIFLNHLIERNHQNEITNADIKEETLLMLIGGSETSALSMSNVLLVMGMYPDIQEKIFEELISIFHDDNRDITLKDTNSMKYLERVIKEVMRLVPAVGSFSRYITNDIHLDSYVFPAGSNLFIPIIYIHRNPDLWPDPLKFDPDRFLPEEVEKRPRCAYIPFSFGPRNCIGLNYAMLSMKIILATILKRYKVTKSVHYKKIEDIDLKMICLAKPKKGHKIVLERRNK